MIFFSGFSSISHLMLIALEYFMLIRGAGWLNCKQGEEQTRKKGKNSAKVQNNIHLLPRMSGYRKKANHFFIWSLEEHMISCLRFPPFNFLLIWKLDLFLQTLQAAIRRSTRHGWSPLRCSRTVWLGFISHRNMWRTLRSITFSYHVILLTSAYLFD